MPSTDSTAVIECPLCHGDHADCLACRGTGTVKECTLCKGSGYDLADECTAQHDACNGTGYVPAE